MARQLGLTSPKVKVQLAQSLSISHLLFGCVVWSPTLPTVASLRPPRSSPVAYPIQLAFSGLLRWALDVPLTTRLELLHALANLPPAWMLLAK